MKFSASLSFFLFLALFALVQRSSAEPDYLSNDKYWECIDDCQSNCEDTADDNAEDKVDDYYSSCWHCMNRKCKWWDTKCHAKKCAPVYGIKPKKSQQCKDVSEAKHDEFWDDEYDRCWKRCSKNCRKRYNY